jgi:hypothetical protein
MQPAALDNREPLPADKIPQPLGRIAPFRVQSQVGDRFTRRQ